MESSGRGAPLIVALLPPAPVADTRFDITRRRFGHETAKWIRSVGARSAREPCGVESDDAGFGNGRQRPVSPPARAESRAAGIHRGGQPGVQLVPERLRSSSRNLLRI